MKKKSKTHVLGFNLDQLRQWFLYWLVVGIGLFILVFLITTTWIGVSVKEKCLAAQGKYDGDCVQALIQTLDSDSDSNRERNNAIWALGQLGDVRALSVLEKYYTGNIPEREPYDDDLSQYEMKKALKLVKGGLNITHWVWKNDQLN
jgi:hypothetical protein